MSREQRVRLTLRLLVICAGLAAGRTRGRDSGVACSDLANQSFVQTTINSATVVPADAISARPEHCQVNATISPALVPGSASCIVCRSRQLERQTPGDRRQRLGGRPDDRQCDPGSVARLRHSPDRQRASQPESLRSHLVLARARPARRGGRHRFRPSRGSRHDHRRQGGRPRVLRPAARFRLLPGMLDGRPSGLPGGAALSERLRRRHLRCAGPQHRRLHERDLADPGLPREPGSNLLPAHVPLLAQRRGRGLRRRFAGSIDVADGIITNPLRCEFDPRSLQCADPLDGSDPTCLSARQVETVREMYRGHRTPDGEVIAEGITHGSEPDWALRSVGIPAFPLGLNAVLGCPVLFLHGEAGSRLQPVRRRRRCTISKRRRPPSPRARSRPPIRTSCRLSATAASGSSGTASTILGRARSRRRSTDETVVDASGKRLHARRR